MALQSGCCMRHLARHLALVVCVVLVGSVAHAAPHHRHHHKLTKKSKTKHHKVAKHVDEEVALADEDIDAPPADAERSDSADDVSDDQPRPKKVHRSTREDDAVAFASPEADVDATGEAVRADDEVDAVVPKHSPKHSPDWHFAIGPNMWLASVDANVALGGGSSVGAGVDFVKLGRYTKYAVPALAEGRYGRFSLVGDMTYAVMGIDGMNQVGPFNVAVDGTIGSLQLDTLAGVRLIGATDSSPITIEARGGLRYSRTSIQAAVGVSGTAVTPPEQIMSGADALAGARVFWRPTEHFGLSGAADIGVFGDSNRTWSAGIDANARIGSHVLVSAGYKTMTTDSSFVNIVMHGPKLSVQVAF